MYDLLLFLHVLSAFVLVTGTVCLVPYTLTRAEGPLVEQLTKAGGIMAAVGSVGSLILGIALIADADYEFFTLWIVGALVLWAVATGTGERIVKVERAQARTLHLVAAAGLVGILVLMIWKPGA